LSLSVELGINFSKLTGRGRKVFFHAKLIQDAISEKLQKTKSLLFFIFPSPYRLSFSSRRPNCLGPENRRL
jgi:hypothetical protein